MKPVDLAYWLGRGDAEQGAGSPYERYLLILLLCLGLIILYRRRLDWYKAIKDNIWLMVLICYMFMSIFWSEIPFISFKRWTRELIAVIMAFVILSEADPRNAMQSVLRRSIYVLIPLSLLLVMFFPEIWHRIFREYMDAWIGVTGRIRINLADYASLLCFFSFGLLVSSWQNGMCHLTRYQTWIDILVLGIALYSHERAGNRQDDLYYVNNNIGFGIGEFFGLLLMKRFKRASRR